MHYKPLKILIIGDTHRRDLLTRAALDEEAPFDMLLHTGDAEGSEDYIRSIAEAPCHFVSGNCDYSPYPEEEEIVIGPHRALLAHGHRHRVKTGLLEVVSELKARDIDLFIHGHTHIPRAEYIGGVLVLSPGSLAEPRQESRKKTYLILRMDEKGELNYELKSL